MPVALHAFLACCLPVTCTGQDGARGAVPALEFVYHQRVVFVRARVGEESGLLFLLDTGASASAVHAATAERLELPMGAPTRVEGSAGVIEVDTVLVDELALGEHVVRGITATVQDLGGSLAPPGERIDGILGYDFLGAFALELDFAAKRLRLLDAPLGELPGALPFELDNGIPRLVARLDGRVSADLRLDTGASLFESEDVYVNVTERVWEELRRLDPSLAPSQYFTGTGTGGEVRLPVARIGSLSVGERTLTRPWVIVQPAQGYFARPEAVGFVGNNFLEKFGCVTIDYPGRRLALGPRAP
jgi:hypothetical protein